MIERIKRAIKRFIIDAVVDDYVRNGRMRSIVADGGTLTDRDRLAPPPPRPTIGQVPMSDYR